MSNGGQKVNYIICDDEPRAAESLQLKILELEPDACVRIFTSLQGLLFNIDDIAGRDRIDGLFMDIRLRGENGIRGSEQIISAHPEINLVYITGYGNEYLQEIFCVSSNVLPVAVLEKPVSMKYLKNALCKIKEHSHTPELLPIKSSGTVNYLKTAEIIYITSDKRKLLISTCESSYEVYGKLSELFEKLPGGFLQCHKSFVVNIRHITRINSWTSLEMSDGSVIPISRTYRENIKTSVTLVNP